MQNTINIENNAIDESKRYHPTLLRNDGTRAYSDEHKLDRYESFSHKGEAGDDHYEEQGRLLHTWLNSQACKEGIEVLGRAATDISWEDFLAKIPEARRGAYACKCCGDWFRRNATVVIVNAQGETTSLYWNSANVPEILKEAYAYAKQRVEDANVMHFYESDSITAGRRFSGTLNLNGKKFTHYHDADVPEIKAPKDFPAGVRLQEIIAALPNTDNVLTKAADLRKAILEVESQSDIVLGHLRILDAYVEIAKVTGRARGGRYDRQKAWNASFYHLTNVTQLHHFESTAIGKALRSWLDGTKIEDVLNLYFANIDPTKYKRKTAEVANGRLAQAEKFFVGEGYDKSLNLKAASRNTFIDAAEKADRLLWVAKQDVVVEKKPDLGDTGLFGHMRKDVRDEQNAEKVEKPTFKSISISLHSFMKNWLKKAIKISVKNPAAATANMSRMEMQYQEVAHKRTKLAVILATVIESPTGEGTKPIWYNDEDQLASQGHRWPYLTFNLDARSATYIQNLGSFWSGLRDSTFEVTEVVIDRFGNLEGQEYKDDRSVIRTLGFVVPSIRFLAESKGDIESDIRVRGSYFPHSLIGKLQPYRDVMEQYIADRGYDKADDPEQGFATIAISADPNITILVETEDGIQPIVIATVD